MSRIFQRLLLIFVAALALSSCGTMGGLSKAENDPALVTGSVPVNPNINTAEVSDANTIRNAISAVDMSKASSVPFGWANRETGSAGTISKVAEISQEGTICRNFETSRESYEGVALFHGAACIGADGQWYMQEFAQI